MKIKILILTFFILFGLPFFTIGQLTPHAAILQMQKGINLGNTFEPPLEAGWNNPVAQEYYFDLYKEAGFNCIRIPVRWDKHTQESYPYKIDETWLQRVEEVLDWGLERDLFVIINAHHDDWIKQNYTNPAYRERFDSIWAQISTRFSSKPEKLIFEILNEPYGLSKEQNDDLHQRILTIIRKTNQTRIVIFQGHNWGGSDELLTAAKPDDNYVIGSFHSYDPYTFGLLGEGTWGTSSDINVLNNKFNKVKNWSDTSHIPVILGEFGSLRSCDYNSRMKHYKTYVELAQKYGFAYCAWDDGGDFLILRRAEHKWDEVKDILLHTSAISPKNPQLKIIQDTIIQLQWTNVASDNDSIFIERRTTNTDYLRIAALKGDTTGFYDVNPSPDIYYHYRIIAHYNSDENIYSHPVRVYMPVYVPKVRESFLGSPAIIPGTIEAENFDKGGEGYTYHDVDPGNLPGDYRPLEGVDIYSRNGDGYHIGNALPGEWYEYMVFVENNGEYIVDFLLAAVQSGGTFKIKIGESESETLTAPNSNSWLTTKIVSDTLDLIAGEQILRFTVLELPLFNIDKFVFSTAVSAINNISFQDQPLTVFQNQNHELVFNLKNEKSIKWLQVYDITGSLIRFIQNPEKNGKMSIPGIPAGLYIVQALLENQRYTTKIIVL